MTDLTELKEWRLLESHLSQLRRSSIKSFFNSDPQRFHRFCHHLPGLTVDMSKNFVTEETMHHLVSLARESGLEAWRDQMMSGHKINTTEDRAVLHTALRAAPEAVINADGVNVVPEIHEVLARMARFCTSVRDGRWLGHSGREITDIVNIGIGGSSLGPQLVTEALAHFHHDRLRAHFVANVEASEISRILQPLNPETTLFIVASKTFTTAETMQNARVAREWLLKYYRGDQKSVARHFVAASTNAAAVTAFGIAPENMFPFRDWVGGRYSLWSAIGLSVMLMVGPENFAELLAGAETVDMHFLTEPLEKNIPVLLGLIGIWYRNFLHYPACAVIPYHASLRRLPAFLQQLDMESNGKAAGLNGRRVTHATGPIIFGEPGTDAQHSFFQWLHQSPDVVPVDFIAAVRTPYGTEPQQTMLLANCLAQAEALMTGKDNLEEPHRHFTGNRPSTMFLLDELTPRALGSLLALYEHKVFVQGALWRINSFDQWGVELGKVLASALSLELAGGPAGTHDGSTLGLIAHIRRVQEQQ